MLAYLEKMKDILFILVVTAAYSVIAHTVGSNGDLAAGSIGALVLVVITVIGIVISWLPGFKMLPWCFGSRCRGCCLHAAISRVIGFWLKQKMSAFYRLRRPFLLTAAYA